MAHMAKNRLRILLITLSLGVILLMTGCGLSGGPVEGKVIDKTTGKPVDGVIVVVGWTGSTMTPAHSQTQCFHVESTVTDENGKYSISRWFSTPKPLMGTKTYITLYKTGYQEAEWFSEDIKYLVPFTGTREERLAYLERLIRSGSCHSAGASKKALFPLYKSLYEEAKRNGETDKKTLEWFRYVAASVWLADHGDVSQREHDRKIKEFLKDHLQ